MKNTRLYWRKFRQTLISPQFHWFFLKARLKANLVDAPLYRRLMSLIVALVAISVVTLTNSWATFLVAWVFPLTILYHISALCQICSEHLWGATGSIESKSHGRFCGEAPPFGSTFKDWFGWAIRMFFYHLPIRIAVLSDPEICPHDHHHSYPKDDKNWPNAIYNRQEQVDAGAEYREYWGLHNAMEAVFQNLAEQPSLSEAEIKRLLDNK
ncbi:hypothetical protein [Pleurocapsa sp. PCC 7327]|uniref:hypothetical protein n=1 Tax=Pleurocapsa sp. PCC 7327 TaxID=118163 RepID=UPI00031B4DF4|nr:hypothetical protein [Pleurocapsa sp. PCC 7327]